MQKVLRRNLLARNQGLKSKRKKDVEEMRDSRRKAKDEKAALARAAQSYIKAERKNRLEDWMLGPLAPNRLAGKDSGAYGMLSYRSLVAPTVPLGDREKYFNFAVNDRVVMLKGREKGKIGRVLAVNQEKQTVQVADVNMADIKILPYEREMRNQSTPYLPQALPVSIHDVRLVVSLRDDLTGKVKDTVVQHMQGGEPTKRQRYGSSTPEHTRYISGPDKIRIPWPRASEPRFEDRSSDTLAPKVRERSFGLSLMVRPHPESVLDELRNRYSRTRTDHTPQYIQEKIKEDAKEQWQRRRRMLLPQQEYWERKVRKRESQESPGITQETMDLIQDMQRASLQSSGPETGTTQS